MSYQSLLQTLVQTRKMRKITQSTVAERMGVAASTISAWEIGANHMGLDDLGRYAEAVGTTIFVAVESVEMDQRILRLRRAMLDGTSDPAGDLRMDLVVRAVEGVMRAPLASAEMLVTHLEDAVAADARVKEAAAKRAFESASKMKW